MPEIRSINDLTHRVARFKLGCSNWIESAPLTIDAFRFIAGIQLGDIYSEENFDQWLNINKKDLCAVLQCREIIYHPPCNVLNGRSKIQKRVYARIEFHW